MNKKTGCRRERFIVMCVQVETGVTKCSWRWLWFQIVLWTRDFVHRQGRASRERGQYRQWQRWGEVKRLSHIQDVFRSTPAKKRGTIEVGTRKHQGGIGSVCQSSRCVSDRNRSSQRSLRASRRIQQVVKRLNVCENSCLGTNWQTL